MPVPPADDYLSLLESALVALRRGDRVSADYAIKSLAVELPPLLPRKPLSRQIRVEVLKRDHFTCRYCAGRTVPTPVLRAVSTVWPTEVPWNTNWRTDSTHPIHELRSATFDHVAPHARGGQGDPLDNLVTACSPCNTCKGGYRLEQLGWVLLDPVVDDWDGLISSYPALWEAGKDLYTPGESQYHRSWMKAFGVTS
jgi:5-methylcytosine-specific restriction endonuclease McrA